ncbi:MAG: nucleoid-associated protein [Bacteroidota bacterium]|nr:nucleoid-associated protein [Bacteroidota bacterium]
MNLSNTTLKNLSVHFIGNKSQGDELVLSKKELNIDIDLSMRLKEYFLGKFNAVYDKYCFSHASDIKYNEVYNFVSEYFANGSSFQNTSEHIAKHLYESSIHPKVKAGELYVCHFENCEIDNKVVNAIGIFKTENKSGFFEVDQHKNEFSIIYKEGIDITKFDKGCLIYDTNEDQGFVVSIIDNQNRGEEALYWKETFLGLTQVSNDFHQTNQFLSIAKSYVTKQVPEEFEVTKADQIDLLNRSVEYFKNHEKFDKGEFESEVFQHKSIIESFQKFDETYRENHELKVPDSFDISPQAVKKQARVFKSILKLDKNFHIYIHGNKDMIEQGVEKDGRKYYKIYYEKEA